MAVPQIRVANFQFCCDQDCLFQNSDLDLHLVITTRETDLKQQNAVAISYTWGEFYRKKRCIGHTVSGVSIFLELGEEWNVMELITRLAELCEESEALDQPPNACWIDQLCIPQKDEEIRKALASIPSVYRTLDVVAILPGALCQCAKQRLDELKDPESDIGLGWHSADVEQCLNRYGCNSWFNRVWTRQELQYSRRIRAVWTSDETSMCEGHKNGNFDPQRLNTFLHLTFTQALAQGFSDALARDKVLSAYNKYKSHGALAMGDLGLVSQRGLVASALLEFLSGKQVESRLADDTGFSQEHKIKLFLLRLYLLSIRDHSATETRDYVAAIWVDCPGYTLPTSFKTKDLPELLEDAIIQFENTTRTTFITTAPAGLFGKSSSTGLWRPTTYLLPQSVQSIKQIYSAITTSEKSTLPLAENGAIPLRSLGCKTSAMSVRAGDYVTIFAGWPTSRVFNAIREVVDFWPQETMLRIEQNNDSRIHPDPFKGLSFKEFGARAFREKIKIDVNQKFAGILGGGGGTWPWNDEDGINHHDIVYEMVCNALGLDRDACKKHALKLMVSLENPPCIGLTLQILGKPKTTHQDVIPPRDLDDSTTTICMARGPRDYGCTLFEAVQVGNTSGTIPKYRVVGVWVPQIGAAFNEIGYMAAAGASDAHLI